MEEEYININNFGKSILLIEKCFKFISEKIDKNFDKKIYKLIFFENITLNTDEIFLELIDFLGLKYNKETYKKIKIKNKLPRKTSNVVEGFLEKIHYRKY